MKSVRIYFLFSVVFFTLGKNELSAQKLHFGPEVGYLTDMKIRFNPTQVGNFVIAPTYMNNKFYDGYRVGLFVEQRISPSFGMKVGGGFSETFGGGNAYVIASGLSIMGTAVDHQIIDLNATGSVFLFPNTRSQFARNLQLNIGASYWRFGVMRETPLDLVPEEPGMPASVLFFNEIIRYQYAIEQSFLKNVFAVRVGLPLPITKRFFVEGIYERTITPVSRQIVYRDMAYRFEQNTQRIVISVGYRFGRK